MQSDCSDIKRFIDSIDGTDMSLIETALTHPSVPPENNETFEKSYERLEFLGDAVLKLLASDYLYKRFPHHKEGELSKIRSFIVSDETLAKIAKKVNLIEHIKAAKNDKTINKNDTIAACAFEAILGALYLCGKYSELKEFFSFNFAALIEDIEQDKLVLNPKATLQEYTQAKSKIPPVYKTINETGAAHNKTFEVSVSYQGEVLANGAGKTKKAAQQEAAYQACKKLGLLNENQKDK